MSLDRFHFHSDVQPERSSMARRPLVRRPRTPAERITASHWGNAMTSDNAATSNNAMTSHNAMTSDNAALVDADRIRERHPSINLR
jgi:hypothetical protein